MSGTRIGVPMFRPLGCCRPPLQSAATFAVPFCTPPDPGEDDVPGRMGLVICDLPMEEEQTLHLAVVASRSDWRGADGLYATTTPRAIGSSPPSARRSQVTSAPASGLDLPSPEQPNWTVKSTRPQAQAPGRTPEGRCASRASQISSSCSVRRASDPHRARAGPRHGTNDADETDGTADTDGMSELAKRVLR